MKFTILGSGTCVPRKDAGTAGILVQTKNKNILLDGGSGTLDRLANTQVSYKEMDMMLVSHLHPDHTLTIPALCQSLNFTPQYNRTKPLFLAGPPGFKTFWEQINVAWNCAPRPDTYEIKVFEINGRADFQGVAITTLVYPEGVHYGPCQGIKIEEDGKSLVYTGDMGYWEGIVDFARGCDVLIADCSYPVKDTPGHLSLPSVMKLAGKIQPRAVILSHLYYPRKKYNVDRFREGYDGNVILAADLITVEL